MDIVLLGSGNVATHLGLALVGGRHRILQVYSPTKAHAESLADRLQADAVDSLADVTAADCYIIAVKDDAIGTVAAQLPSSLRGIVVHTAGSVALDVLIAHPKRGVLYPVQTFSKAKAVDFSVVPLALEASDEAAYAQLARLANSLSVRVFSCDSRQRLALHVAAVFACNFTNHLYAIGAAVLREYALDFDLIRPLILETDEKVMEHQPEDAQTGPAVRHDTGTIQKHLAALSDRPDLAALYRLISDHISHPRVMSSK